MSKQAGTIRSVARAISVLQTLNQKREMRPADLAQATGIPRPTVYRLLETLEELHLVQRDQSSERWRIALQAKSLSAGFREMDWVSQAALPEMNRLSREILWPLDLNLCINGRMEVRETTMNHSPWSMEYGMVGRMLPMLPVASGRAWLAFCPDQERTEILSLLCSQFGEEPPFMTSDGPLQEVLKISRDLGLGYRRHGFREETMSLSAPIYHEGRVMACLTVIWLKTAVKFDVALRRYAQPLQETAAAISKRVRLPD